MFLYFRFYQLSLKELSFVVSGVGAEALACPLNYASWWPLHRLDALEVTRFDTYCGGTSCDVARDLNWCCERGMALMYYRFLPLDLRQQYYTVVQMSDFFIYNQQVQVDGYDQAVFYCDPCDTPVNGREDPPNLGDSNVQTKWLDYSRNGFYVKSLGVKCHSPFPWNLASRECFFFFFFFF